MANNSIVQRSPQSVKREVYFVKRDFKNREETSAAEQVSPKAEVSKIRNFRDLNVWQLGKQIVCHTYKLSQLLPREEIYGLVSQIRRASVSIPSNIAEGFNRFHNKEYRQFLYIALGSCAELETQLEVGVDLNYFKKEHCEDLLEKLDHASRMLRNLIKKL